MTEPRAQPTSGEEAIIQRHLAPLSAGLAGAFGLLDDCAALTPPDGCDVVLKTDPIRAGVHFFPDDRPENIAWKALAVNVSDLAAKGAEPVAYLMSLSFPQVPDDVWLTAFAEGLRAAQAAFGCVLAGGDTDRAAGPLSIGITVLGTVPTGRMVRRGGGQAGDVVFVTGTIGDAALGLALRRGDATTATWPIDAAGRTALIQRYQRPTPRLGLRAALRAYASAAMDVSDGLAKDFDRLCRASGTGGVIRVADVPLSDAARALVQAEPGWLSRLVSHGDDYEVLAAVPPAQADAFRAMAVAAGCAVSAIGRLAADAAVSLTDATGQPLTFTRPGYDHF